MNTRSADQTYRNSGYFLSPTGYFAREFRPLHSIGC